MLIHISKLLSTKIKAKRLHKNDFEARYLEIDYWRIVKRSKFETVINDSKVV